MSAFNNYKTITMPPSEINDRPADAGKADKKAPSGKAPQITLTINLELLDKVDAAAKSLNISRAGFIKMCLSNAVKERA